MPASVLDRRMALDREPYQCLGARGMRRVRMGQHLIEVPTVDSDPAHGPPGTLASATHHGRPRSARDRD